MYRIIILLVVLVSFNDVSMLAQKRNKSKEISIAKSLEYTADSLLEENKYRVALDNFYKAAVIFETNEFGISAAKNYRQTAWCYHLLKYDDSAQYFTDKSYDLLIGNVKEKDGEKRMLEESLIYYMQARIHLRENDFDSTFHYLDKGFNILTELNSLHNSYNLVVARFLQTYGTTNYTMGKYDVSLNFNFQALSIRQKEVKPGHIDIINSYYNIVKIYYSKRDFEKAKQYLWYIIENCKEKYLTWKAVSYNGLGVIGHWENQYNESINYYNKAKELYMKAGDTLAAAVAMSNLGQVYAGINDFESALENVKTSISIRKKFLGDSDPAIAKSLVSLGIYHYKANRYNDAIKVYFEALKILEENQSKDKLFKSDIYNKIGLMYLEIGDLNKALCQFQHAIVEIVNGFYYEDELENPQIFFEGTNIFNNNLEILSKPSLFSYIVNKAITYSEMYESDRSLTDKLKQSHTTYLLALKVLEIVRQDISEGESKYFLSAEKKIYYKNAIDVSFKLDSLFPERQYSNYVFELVDKCKSPSLRDKFYVSNALNNSNIPEELIEKEKAIAKKLAFYNTQLSKSRRKSEDKNVNYDSDYDKLLVEYDTLGKYFEKKYPDYYKLIYEQKVVNIKDIQNQLDKNAALINYFVAGTSLYIVTITKNKLDHKIIEIDSLFKEKIINYYIDIKYDFTEKELKRSSELYQYLIEPIEELIMNKNKLIIIPDEYLYYIPFETLCRKKSSTTDLSKVDFLIKNYAISYHHSATLWLNNAKKRTRQKIKNNDFIGFAPVFDSKTNNSYILSREWMPDTTTTEVATRSVSTDLNHFNALPYSEEEIRSIAKLFSKKGKEAESYFYGNATEENFKQNARNYSYIHIASHSFANDNYPTLSGIAFSQPDTSVVNKNGEDGILYAGETYSLDLSNAELIVLSSCKSGLGKLVKGDGFLSLSRGFLYSGTSNIIFSLWNVDDEQTKDLMVEFYSQLLKGMEYSNALRKAKLKLLNNPKSANTKYWAAWVLVGK